MGIVVERKVIHRFPGRGKEVRDIKQRLSGRSPKLAIIGAHGSGKTQLVNNIAVSFAQGEPLSGPGDLPFMTRLLNLNLSILIAEEAHQEGWASSKLRAAKKKIENASQHRGKDGQGVQFVIVVGMSFSFSLFIQHELMIRRAVHGIGSTFAYSFAIHFPHQLQVSHHLSRDPRELDEGHTMRYLACKHSDHQSRTTIRSSNR